MTQKQEAGVANVVSVTGFVERELLEGSETWFFFSVVIFSDGGKSDFVMEMAGQAHGEGAGRGEFVRP